MHFKLSISVLSFIAALVAAAPAPQTGIDFPSYCAETATNTVTCTLPSAPEGGVSSLMETLNPQYCHQASNTSIQCQSGPDTAINSASFVHIPVRIPPDPFASGRGVTPDVTSTASEVTSAASQLADIPLPSIFVQQSKVSKFETVTPVAAPGNTLVTRDVIVIIQNGPVIIIIVFRE